MAPIHPCIWRRATPDILDMRFASPVNFHYFSMRKMHFLGRARALVAFPGKPRKGVSLWSCRNKYPNSRIASTLPVTGGWGTMDELFEALTLIQTKKMAPVYVQAR